MEFIFEAIRHDSRQTINETSLVLERHKASKCKQPWSKKYLEGNQNIDSTKINRPGHNIRMY